MERKVTEHEYHDAYNEHKDGSLPGDEAKSSQSNNSIPAHDGVEGKVEKGKEDPFYEIRHLFSIDDIIGIPKLLHSHILDYIP